jgi:hypothetical protein
MVGTRRPGKGRNMETIKTTTCAKCIQVQTIIKRCIEFIFINETGRILNEKMMPDVTIMVLELDIVKINVSETKITMDKRRGTRNVQTLHPQTLPFHICF